MERECFFSLDLCVFCFSRHFPNQTCVSALPLNCWIEFKMNGFEIQTILTANKLWRLSQLFRWILSRQSFCPCSFQPKSEFQHMLVFHIIKSNWSISLSSQNVMTEHALDFAIDSYLIAHHYIHWINAVKSKLKHIITALLQIKVCLCCLPNFSIIKRSIYPFGVKKILSSETINNNKKRRIKSKYIKISCESSILSSQYTKQGKYQEKQEIGLWDWINYWRTNSSKCWNFFAKVKSRAWSEILTQFFDAFSHASQLSLMQTFWFFAFNGIKDVNRLR